jgi:hypothetical protein
MDIKKTVKDGIDNARDSVKEGLHRSAADAERARRELDGDKMTAGEKLKSVAGEVKERTQAEIDKAKREVRGRT